MLRSDPSNLEANVKQKSWYVMNKVATSIASGVVGMNGTLIHVNLRCGSVSIPSSPLSPKSIVRRRDHEQEAHWFGCMIIRNIRTALDAVCLKY